MLERWVQRGVLNQLLLMTSLIAIVALLGGICAWTITPAFESLSAAVWWSFLRLTDPGYLGDDEGTILRVISTIVTVLGYVLFMGSLIAIMTQWLARTIRNLESGLTPITMENHFVILGWTNRTPEIIKKLMTAGGRLERFLAKRAGLDIVGDKLMEINVFSPGGLCSAQKFEKVNFNAAVIEALKQKVEYMDYYQRNFDNIDMATFYRKG